MAVYGKRARVAHILLEHLFQTFVLGLVLCVHIPVRVPKLQPYTVRSAFKRQHLLTPSEPV